MIENNAILFGIIDSNGIAKKISQAAKFIAFFYFVAAMKAGKPTAGVVRFKINNVCNVYRVCLRGNGALFVNNPSLQSML